MPAGDDLEHLLGRLARGDEEAFGLVYDQVAGPVYGLARILTDDDRWSQQLAEEALARVWRAAPRYDSAQSSGWSWVMSIARQHLVTRFRAARVVRRRPHRQGLDGAGAAEREAVELALRGGYTQGEISDRLGLAPEEVARLIRAGLLQAAAELAG